MRITTSLLPVDFDSQQSVELAVAIDVLRATSVMATALQAGADRIITCRDIDDAIRIASNCGQASLLAGERNCVLIPGFDLGNSPSEYTSAVVRGKTIVLTTTNGTAAIETGIRASEIIAGSFLNLAPTITEIGKFSSVNLICAGTDGRVSNEDVLLAGAIIAGCQQRFDCQIADDSSVLASRYWDLLFPAPDLPDPGQLAAVLRETRGGHNLLRAGFDHDIDLCSQIDSIQAVPRVFQRDPITFHS